MLSSRLIATFVSFGVVSVYGDGCAPCEDKQSPYMHREHIYCPGSWQVDNQCGKSFFQENYYCQKSCFCDKYISFDGVDCCCDDPEPSPKPILRPTPKPTPKPTPPPCGVNGPPEGYDSYLTLIANGEYNAAVDPVPYPEAFCLSGICLTDYFGRVFMGRSAEEEAKVKEDAKSFFQWRFGLSVDDLIEEGKLRLSAISLDTRVNYRAYVISGLCVPTEGFEVVDGGYVIQAVVDITLGGEFEGQVMPQGGSAIYGEYRIFSSAAENNDEDIIVSFRSKTVNAPNPTGQTFSIVEALFGRNLENQFAKQSVDAQGVAFAAGGVPLDLGNGTTKSNLRNTITFGGEFAGF